MRSRLALLCVLVLAVVGLGACGTQKPVARADTEGSYFTVGSLRYQVQISRQINPTDREDRDYLTGLAAQDQRLPNGDVFFGVFVRVENQTDRPVPSAEDFTIADTQGNEFRPLSLTNNSAYKAITIPGGGTDPDGVEPASYEPTQGKLLLFKLPNGSLVNRPLELTVKSPKVPQQVGSVELDV